MDMVKNDFVDESILAMIVVQESILTTRYCLTNFYLKSLVILLTILTFGWLFLMSHLLGFQPFVILYVLVLLLDIFV